MPAKSGANKVSTSGEHLSLHHSFWLANEDYAQDQSGSKHGVRLPALSTLPSPKKPSGVDALVNASGTEQLVEPRAAESSVSSEVGSLSGPDAASRQEAGAGAELETIPKEEVEQANLHGDGTVRVVYQQYDELFPIAGGSTTQAAIDDVYCLSFVMPNCRLHLSRYEDADRFVRLERGESHESVFVRELPLGTFVGLEADQTYFVVVEQEAEQLERDQQATRELWSPEREREKLARDDGRGFESCSCIYGNPCVDEYGCRDWHSRFAVATANGWKGF